MSYLKKLSALMIAFIMVLTMCTTVFAAQNVKVGADTDTGSITVTNATVDKEYSLYKLFDATYQTGTDAVAYSYTKTGDTDALYTLLTGADSPFELEQIRDTSKYNVRIKTGKDAAAVSKWITDHQSSFTPVKTVTATDYELNFTHLPFGYYFITSELGAVLTIDSNTPSVNVIDKNQGPSWDIDDNGTGKVITSDSNKTYEPPVTENTVNVGDTVNFKIGVNTTNYNKDNPIMEYFITDTLGKGFAYNDGSSADRPYSVRVFIGKETDTNRKELTKATSNPIVGENYMIEWDNTNNRFKITVPWCVENGTTKTFASADANNVLTVTYSAVLLDNQNTVYAGAGNKNTSTYDFRDKSNTTPPPGGGPYHTVDNKETTTYTYALGFQKVDSITKEKLSGAEFKVKNAAGKYLVATEEQPAGSGVYLYSGTADNETAATTFKTDNTGMLLVKGVAEGTYTVIETKAPQGYNVLPNPETIKAEKASATSYTTSHTTYFDKDGNIINEEDSQGSTVTTNYKVAAVNLMVNNSKGTELPETGGIGTTLFYVIGSLLVICAFVLLITRRRMKYEN